MKNSKLWEYRPIATVVVFKIDKYTILTHTYSKESHAYVFKLVKVFNKKRLSYYTLGNELWYSFWDATPID